MSRLLAVVIYILISRMRTPGPRPEPAAAGDTAAEAGQDSSWGQQVSLDQILERYGSPVRYTVETGGSPTGWHVLLPHQPDRL